VKLPLGFRYASLHAGIRRDERDDVALIVADETANAAAVFTRNVVQAAPVQVAKQHLKASGGKVKAVLINAGNANCATRTGDEVARVSCATAAKALGVKPNRILPASTGVIGVELPVRLLTDAIPKLTSTLTPDAFEAVAKAILTTDTRMKVAGEELSFKRGTVRVAGLTKGSGMIHPNMATTLGFVMTDADLSPSDLREILAAGVEGSFNSLSVDGDMSTNDVVALLASGASPVKVGSREKREIGQAVGRVLESLARQIAADGEGARKLVVIEASGFRSNEDARKVARAIANSPLVKTAIAGSDPNWGRILAAAGYSGVPFQPSKVDIYFQDVLVCRKGLAVEMDEAALKSKLDNTEVSIRITQRGWSRGVARFFTCDLTEGYIQINGSYRT
jgi:glutamate N-acetyltransferase / amino-acid N-acetyltransferase